MHQKLAKYYIPYYEFFNVKRFLINDYLYISKINFEKEEDMPWKTEGNGALMLDFCLPP